MAAEIGVLGKATSGVGLPGGEDLCERVEIEAERKGRPQQVFCSRPGMRLIIGLGISHGQLKICVQLTTSLAKLLIWYFISMLHCFFYFTLPTQHEYRLQPEYKFTSVCTHEEFWDMCGNGICIFAYALSLEHIHVSNIKLQILSSPCLNLLSPHHLLFLCLLLRIYPWALVSESPFISSN